LHWIEYFADGRWRTVHIVEAAREAPAEYLALWRGDEPLIELSGGQQHEACDFDQRSYELATRTANTTSSAALEKKLIEFSLFGLPLQSQALFRTLMVIPVA